LKGELTYFNSIYHLNHCWDQGDVVCIGKEMEYLLKTDMTTVFTNLETKYAEDNLDAIVTIQVPHSATSDYINNALYLQARYHSVEQNTNDCISAAACIHYSYDLHLNEAIEDEMKLSCFEEVLAGPVLYLQVRLDNKIIHFMFHT
jgi:hypothetical protein